MRAAARIYISVTVVAVVLLIVGVLSHAHWLCLNELESRDVVPRSVHPAHDGQMHIVKHVRADDTLATQHCHDAPDACCCNAMSCCAALQPATRLSAGVISHDFTMLTPQQFSSILFVPRLPPRAT